MASTDRKVLALVDRQAATRERLSANFLTLLARLWASLLGHPDDRYDPVKVAAFATQAAALSKGTRTAASGAQEAYLRQVLHLLGTQPGRGAKVTVPDAPRGIDPVQQYTRPVEEFRRLRVSGLDEFEANERALKRLQLIGDTDVSLAVRDTSAQVLASADKVRGWRRVVHPELSRGGTCGLCIASSDRLYKRGDLMPLHERCNCAVVPVVLGKEDPGANLNRDSLSALYRTAGSTKAADLAKVRFVVHEHGELGPVLRSEGDEFRSPADVRHDTHRRRTA